MFLYMRRALGKILESTYSGKDYLSIQRAKIFFFAQLLIAVLLSLVLLLDLLDGSGSIQEAFLANFPVIPLILFGAWRTWRGHFESIAPKVVIGSSLGVVAVGFYLGAFTDHATSFFSSTQLFLAPCIVGAALFSSRRTVLLCTLVGLVYIPLHWILFCSKLAPAVAHETFILLWYGELSILILGAVTYGMVRLFQYALEHIATQLETIRELNSSLELRVAERTTELEGAKNVAEQATRAKSDFLANMSHEIRTPLNGILGMAQLMAKQPMETEQREFLQVILDSGRHLMGVIQNILDYSKIEAGRMEVDLAPVQLDRILTTVSNVVEPKARETGLFFKIQVESGIPLWILADEVRLRQVLLNLASNAIKFTETGGATLKVDRVSQTETSVHLHFSLRDTGIGMNSDALGKLTERFMQAETSTARRFGGTGLGLAISRNLLKLMDSDLHFTSIEGKGSLFEFDLEFSIFHPKQHFQLTPQARLQPQPNIFILVVEDNPVNAKLAQKVLSDMEYPNDLACNGIQALAKLKDRKYDLIVMDCQMPIMDGHETTRTLRSWENSKETIEIHNSRIPIIGLTADAMSNAREACLQSGMNDFLSKPFQIEEMERTIQRCLTQRP